MAGNKANELPDRAGGQGHRVNIQGMSGAPALSGNDGCILPTDVSRNTAGSACVPSASAAARSSTRAASPRASGTTTFTKSGTTYKGPESNKPRYLTGTFNERKDEAFRDLLPKAEGKAPVPQMSDDERRKFEFLERVSADVINPREFLDENVYDIPTIKYMKLMACNLVFEYPGCLSTHYYTSHPDEVLALEWLRTFVVRSAITAIKAGPSDPAYMHMFQHYKDTPGFHNFWSAAGNAVDVADHGATPTGDLAADLVEVALELATPQANTTSANVTNQAGVDTWSDGLELSETSSDPKFEYLNADLGGIKVETTVEQTEEILAPGSTAPSAAAVTAYIESTAANAVGPPAGHSYSGLFGVTPMIQKSPPLPNGTHFNFGFFLEATTPAAEAGIRRQLVSDPHRVSEMFYHALMQLRNSLPAQAQAQTGNDVSDIDSDEEL